MEMAVGQLESEGFVVLPGVLPDSDCDQLLAFLRASRASAVDLVADNLVEESARLPLKAYPNSQRPTTSLVSPSKAYPNSQRPTTGHRPACSLSPRPAHIWRHTAAQAVMGSIHGRDPTRVDLYLSLCPLVRMPANLVCHTPRAHCLFLLLF